MKPKPLMFSWVLASSLPIRFQRAFKRSTDSSILLTLEQLNRVIPSEAIQNSVGAKTSFSFRIVMISSIF